MEMINSITQVSSPIKTKNCANKVGDSYIVKKVGKKEGR